MTKKEYESFHYFKEVNKALRLNKIGAKLVSYKDQFGDHRSKWDTEAGNLHEQINIIAMAKTIRDITIKNIRNKEIEEFYRDI